MAKIHFRKSANHNPLLFRTSVENLFISELLPAAPGDYVKVYLYGLMNAEYNIPTDRSVMANVLRLRTDDIEKAWAYWEDKGAVKQVYDPSHDTYQIQFISQIEETFGTEKPENSASAGNRADTAEDGISGKQSPSAPSTPAGKSKEEEEQEELARLEELELRGLYTSYEEAIGRPISTTEMNKITDAVNVYGVTPDVFAYAIKYCSEIEKTGIEYISKVALRWTEEGCRDIAQVRKLLDEDSRKNAVFGRIFREMGFTRLPSPADRDMMTKWMEDWGFKLDQVLEACRTTAGMREPSLKYVNRVLENKLREAGGIDTRKSSGSRSDSYQRNVSKRVLGEYYEYLRNNSELEYQEHLEEVRRKIPGMSDLLTLENELSRAIVNFGFSSRAKQERHIQAQKRRELEEQKRDLLKKYGYPEDYLEKKYKCDICKDYGVTDDGRYCSCAKERVNEAYTWNLKRRK